MCHISHVICHVPCVTRSLNWIFNGRNGIYFFVSETISLLQVQSKVAPLYVQSKVVIAPFYVWSKVCKFVPHLDWRNSDFIPHMEGSYADFAPHKEWRHSFKDKKIDKVAISANLNRKKKSHHLYLHSSYDLYDRFWKWKYFEGYYVYRKGKIQ